MMPKHGLLILALACVLTTLPMARAMAADTEAIRVKVDWGRIKRTVGPMAYGLNVFGGVNPEVAVSPAYRKGMAYMHAGLLRYHSWGVMGDSSGPDGWIDNDNKHWDAEKIKRTMTGTFAYGPQVMVNIPGWPSWMDRDEDGYLDADSFDAYADFCADLVRIVNKDLNLGVRYWEITNERDDIYWVHPAASKQKTRTRELVDIYNRAAVAMKKVDPTILTGGPAAARPDMLEYIRVFLTNALPNLDFVTFHTYASGNRDDADKDIFDRTGGSGNAARIIDTIKRLKPGRPIPAFLDEYNISWSWEIRDPRMTNHKGAIFDALTMVRALDNGVEGTLAWNERDGIYGKMDNSNNLRPSAHLFHLMNSFMIGEQSTATSTAAQVVPFAVAGTKGMKGLLLVNQGSTPTRVQLDLSGWAPGKESVVVHRIGAKGYTTTDSSWKTVSAPMDLEGYSISLMLFID